MATGLDSLTIATQGLLSNNPLLIGVQGLLSVDIDIIPTPIPTPPVIEEGSGGMIGDDPWDQWGNKDKEKKKKKIAKITVKAIVDGKEYVQVAYSRNINISASDIEINVNENAPEPTITVTLKKNN